MARPQRSARPWWKDAVFYQIYPRSFADANGDGVGDLAGITERVPFIADLGVDAIWLSPIFTSPMHDFGYDVADYCDIDPTFGTLADLDRLVETCHAHGLRITLDWVPNHSSVEHPWFVESRSSRDSSKRDWYVWRDPAPDGGPPNNWHAQWIGEPAWTFDEATGQYYLHLFLPEQPDLNWHHPAVVDAMHDTLRFWLDRGIDGFRADVVHLIGKDPALPDVPEDSHDRSPLLSIDEPKTHELLRGIRSLLDGYAHEPMMIGEVYLLEPGQAASYLGHDDELHLTFDFRSAWTPWDATALRRTIDAIQDETPDVGWPTWVLSNHDVPRHPTRFGGEQQARAAAVISLTQRATPYLYAGEELGLPDAHVPDDAVVDPGGRDGCRAPIPWTAEPGHGWGTPTWLPFVDDAAELCFERQDGDPHSMLALYRRLLRLRRAEPTLCAGEQVPLDLGDDIVAWKRQLDDDGITVAVNVSSTESSVALRGAILAGTHEVSDGELAGLLRPWEAVVLRTAS